MVIFSLSISVWGKIQLHHVWKAVDNFISFPKWALSRRHHLLPDDWLQLPQIFFFFVYLHRQVRVRFLFSYFIFNCENYLEKWSSLTGKKRNKTKNILRCHCRQLLKLKKKWFGFVKEIWFFSQFFKAVLIIRLHFLIWTYFSFLTPIHFQDYRRFLIYRNFKCSFKNNLHGFFTLFTYLYVYEASLLQTVWLLILVCIFSLTSFESVSFAFLAAFLMASRRGPRNQRL